MQKIDIILYWVDCNDSDWQKNYIKFKSEFNENSATSNILRFKDWGTLKFIFRMIEKHMPWVNNVYFVTCGQKPDFHLNSKEVICIDHSSYIPNCYLPTFNSSCIELNFNKIQGLSENFFIWNDDFFLFSDVSPSDFLRDDKICDFGKFRIKPPKFLNHFRKTNISNINMVENSNKMAISLLPLYNKILAYFTSKFYEPKVWHFPQIHKKSIWFSVLGNFESDLDEVCKFRYRFNGFNQYLFRNYYLYNNMTFKMSKDFEKNCFSVFIQNKDDINKLVNRISAKTIFVNISETDDISHDSFEEASSLWLSFLENKYPQKSKYEL